MLTFLKKLSEENSNNKRIAKNTLLLYVRMLFIMGVTLYTARVVLDKLGEVDYGIYGAVGSAVAFLGFLNGTLSTGTSRFLTFELGKKDYDKLKTTFNTAFYAHLFLALGIALVMETVGLWFLYNKMVIPEERLFAAEIAFHLSVFATVVSITQVPYTSVIIARENMSIYAYIGIFEALAKLLIVYLLHISSFDRLILYAALVAGVQLIVALMFRFYCHRNYEESILSIGFDKPILDKLIKFSGWSLIANIAETLSLQGVVVLISMFFQPVVVAAQTIGNQISAAMMQFVNSFRTAINPQIIKLYAAKEYEESKKLTLESSIYVFDLLLLLGLPTIVVMEPLLNLWFVEVPEYAVVFAQYIVARQIISNFSSAFYVPMMASGELKWNSYAAAVISVFGFFVMYVLLKLGVTVMIVHYIGVMQSFLFSFVVKPYILCNKIDYRWNEIFKCFLTSFKVAVFPIAISILLSVYFEIDSKFDMIYVAGIIAVSVILSAYINLDQETREKLHGFIGRKFRK